MDKAHAIILFTALFWVTHGCPQRCKCHNESPRVYCRGTGQRILTRGIPKDIKYLSLFNFTVPHLNASYFQGFKELVRLTLNNISIESIAPNTFSGMTKLESLSLASNKLVSIQAGVSKVENLRARDQFLGMLFSDFWELVLGMLKIRTVKTFYSHFPSEAVMPPKP